MKNVDQRAAHSAEDGYLLLGAIVAIALVMIALSVAAVKVSFELRREREVESARRADQYVRAIRRYYLKFGRYPSSVEQLEDTNKIRFLRQKYVDPLTGKPDYRLIMVGQNKTTPKGFFGEPLSGLPGSGPGATLGGTQAPGSAANGPGNNTATMGFGGMNTPAGPAGAQTGGGLQLGSPGFGAQSTNTTGATAAPGATAPGNGSNSSSTTGTGPPGSNIGLIMGVGSSATGDSILTVNEQTTYQRWEFLYDPRVERLRQAGQLNQGVGSAGGNANPAGLGAGPGQPGQTGVFGTGGANPPQAGAGVPPGGTQTNGTQGP